MKRLMMILLPLAMGTIASAQCVSTTCGWGDDCLACHVRAEAAKGVCFDCDTGRPFLPSFAAEQMSALGVKSVLKKEGIDALLATVGLRLPSAAQMQKKAPPKMPADHALKIINAIANGGSTSGCKAFKDVATIKIAYTKMPAAANNNKK